MAMRFTLRELLVVTALIAIAAAWWVDRSRMAQLAAERELWKFRADSAATMGRDNGELVTWEGDAVIMTYSDAVGRRYIQKRLTPAAAAAVVAKSPRGFPLQAPPQGVITRKPSRSQTAK
jgi:prepilin-type N-terminal cleavage/methylation domain-containing protein